ncbi:MAG TPA: glycoside hydrolase family 3 C-terminal domain-containing protein [Steroidobacteraceae bacterium]|nr:glycoside hydrolase family 3 C-terminal domain-containing protein [Steroidobacteraceae bacterium]
MMEIATRALTACVALLAAISASAQGTAVLPYKDLGPSPQQRAADLVQRMTLEEKASQLVNQARAIPRLGVPAYDWWSEALHGVAVNGTTEFPEPIGLAATFDVAGIHEMATAIGVEGRIKHVLAERAGHSDIFEGLDFWAPNVNIFRDPRWGRGQETYGEDPFLSARLAVAFVTGMQGTDPNYYRVISTPKHFAVHSGPEPTRHFADVDVSRHDEEDTYLPAFRAAVVEGHAGSVMCAYNAINGQPACANDFLLQQTLRGAWQFQGYVVSDCGAVRDIDVGHRYRPSQPQASAIALEHGMDNECIDFFEKVKDDHDYRPYIEAVQQGYLSEGAIDTALVRLFTARIRLGMFDPPDKVPYAKLDQTQLDSAAHRSLARRMANESMVLLKNDGLLPLKSVKHILVVGPLADQTAVLLGNYNGIPSHTVSVLEGMRAEFPDAKISYVAGTDFLSNQGTPIPAAVLTTPDGRPGLKADYSAGQSLEARSAPLVSRIEPVVDLKESNLPQQARGKSALSVHWSGFIQPSQTGDYLIGIKASGSASVTVADRQLVQMYSSGASLGRVHLERGRPLKLEVEFGQGGGRNLQAQLIWTPVQDVPDPAAVTAANEADVVVAVVGITSRLEGEEMKVDQPGFLGGDRTSLDMPRQEEDLVQALSATHKPLVVVLMNGSALSVNWEKAHASAILESWYSGEEGGTAIAQTLSGKNNPAGRLPVTFYKDVQQLPSFEDYSMKGRTYRYFQGEPLWPFGYGLSYTRFQYGAMTLPQAPVTAGEPLNVAVTVTNSGGLAGDEVVQLYLKFPDIPGAPNRALRGFQRIHLAPGATQKVEFHLAPRDLSMVTDTGEIIVAQGQYTVSVGGGQPDTAAPSSSGRFEIVGQLTLPE